MLALGYGLVRPLLSLVTSNVFGAIGVASGIAVSALLVASMGGTELAGLGQALGVLGAAIAAIPLAGIAASHGRRRALTLGYCVAVLGAGTVLAGAWFGVLPLLLLGLLMFGFAQATNLQSRYAASELVEPSRRGRTMSLVVWATTLGSVLGPNLSETGGGLARSIGLRELAGPYLFSVAAFSISALVVAFLYGRHAVATAPATRPGAASGDAEGRVGARAALGWAMRHPQARFGVVLLVMAHAIMVGIMSMTSVHLGHEGHGLRVVGWTISLHILGMYALAPVFGWCADKLGPLWTALIGMVILGISIAIAFVAPHDLVAVMVALTILGVGWSASTIAASVLLAGVDSGAVRVPLQGATDALMNYGAATMAILSGLLLSALGFGGLAVVCGLLMVPVAFVGWVAKQAS